MRIARLYTRRVVGTTRSAPIPEAAAAMRRFQVGTLLVMEDPPAFGPPIGIVTDRDLALQGFASQESTVGSVMTPVLATIREESDVHEALEIMRAHGVRRLVVTNSEGGFCGILSIDDVVDGLSADLASAAAVLKGELKHDAAGLGDVKVGG
jgi:CBS domain-containing protein